MIWLPLVVAALPVAAGPITFDQALGFAWSAPRPAAARRAADAKRAVDAHVSRLTLNPTIGLQAGYRFLPTEQRQQELLGDLLLPWNASGQGGARKRAIALEEQWNDLSARATLLSQKLEVARAWIDRWAAQEVLAATARESALAEELERLVDKSAQAGAATRADLADARALAGEARLAVLTAEGDAYARGLELATAIGRDGAAPLAAGGALPDPPLPPGATAEALVERAAHLPDAQVRRLEAEVARARGIEEKAARGHVLTTGLVVQNDAPGGLVVSGLVRWTPPLFDRGERERGVLAADAARAEGERQQAVVRARADFALALHEVEHSAAVLAELRDRLVPASEEAAAARSKIFAAGEGTVVEVLQSRRVAINAAARLARAEADHAWARIKLWLLIAALSGAIP